MNWLNTNLYPFRQHSIELDGHRLNYIDEGTGPVVLFVHGTPEWSFGFRDQIKALSSSFRCIAIDHLGFGLSEKPKVADYTVKQHARRLEQLIEKLLLKNIHIVANDFGGSIALSYAINNPENVNRICIFNTWMWSVSNDPHYSGPGKVMQTWLGKLMYKQFNFPVNVVMPQAYGDRSKLTKEIHRHYKEPLSKPEYRSGTYEFARELLNSGEWWDGLWNRMDRIQNKPFLVFWGMKDKFVPPKELDKWLSKLTNAQVIKFENAGHFLQEEEPELVSAELRKFFSAV